MNARRLYVKKIINFKRHVGLNIFYFKNNIHGNYNIVIYINIVGMLKCNKIEVVVKFL